MLRMANLKDVAYLQLVVVVLVFGVELRQEVQADSPCTRACPKECLHQKSEDPAVCYFSCVDRCTKGENAETGVHQPQGMKEETIGTDETKNTIPTTKDSDVLKDLIISNYDTKPPSTKQH
ncbi:PREDICTED: uncharacterized protein LOC109180701 [Ipomoea nil]|uniref:uncharacterized protein LOC109180701 n=1 Tax=Ipomoea nil TaxID=35883 RepID=UPI0009019C90|nr:PREDICTED: uncharacterized protein LOC109180701 [Ipomoea nil]